MASSGARSGRSRFVSLAPYTTQTITPELFAMRDALETAPAPKLTWDAASMAPMAASRFANKAAGVLPAGFTASLDDWLGVVATGAKLPDGSDDPTRRSRSARTTRSPPSAPPCSTRPTSSRPPEKYDNVEHGTFARDGAGDPVAFEDKPTSKIWVTFAVPTAPMPADGYPAVIVQHGLTARATT